MTPIEQVQGLNKKTTLFIIITQAIMMAWSIVSSIKHLGPTYAFIITIGSFVVYLAYALLTKNSLLLKLLVFGLVAGIWELWADHYSVATINALVYPANEPIIVSSPAYMPFSWAIALVQLGYYSLLLIRWKEMSVATIIMAISGGMYIPMYENLAKGANWWFYHNVPMLWNAPYYIILCEALISLTLPISAYYVITKKIHWSIIIGTFFGIWILISAMIANSIFS